MIYTDILNELSGILVEEFPKLDIKTTPWQVYAGEGYDKLSNRSQILLNIGEIIYTEQDIAQGIPNQHFAGIYDESVSIMISVGKTNLNDNEDFEIEGICKRIIDLFHFKEVQGGIMEFATLSTGVIDENLNYWRHLKFTINYQIKSIAH